MKRALAFVISALAALPGCEPRGLSGPPEVRLGRDLCTSCGMIISEDRCSAALLVERDGHQEYELFDDLGCLLDHVREPGTQERVINTFVRDHGTGAWSDAGVAVFLVSNGDATRTPMGSGMVAFGTRASAEAEQRRSGGDLLDYPTLAEVRRKWSERRLEGQN